MREGRRAGGREGGRECEDSLGGRAEEEGTQTV